jgi:hypothetical protein
LSSVKNYFKIIKTKQNYENFAIRLVVASTYSELQKQEGIVYPGHV